MHYNTFPENWGFSAGPVGVPVHISAASSRVGLTMRYRWAFADGAVMADLVTSDTPMANGPRLKTARMLAVISDAADCLRAAITVFRTPARPICPM